MKILYFAWLRNKTGVSEETVEPPETVETLGDLIDWLKSRGPGYEEAFADLSVVRAAVNQDFATPGDRVAAEDEVAFFPPITGG